MSIKIKNVIPVISDVMTPEMIKYICKYLDADTVVDSEKLTVGPMSVENEYDEALRMHRELLNSVLKRKRKGVMPSSLIALVSPVSRLPENA